MIKSTQFTSIETNYKNDFSQINRSNTFIYLLIKRI